MLVIVLSGLLQYLAKKIWPALLVQKLWGGNKLSKSIFGYFKTKKNKKFRLSLSLGGGRP